MKKLISTAVMLFVVCYVAHVSAQSLEKFKADMGKKSVMGKEIRVPYSDVISYYGYIKPGAKPDEVRGGKNYFYLYVWIPAAAPEIGVRMISPVPESMNPEKEDITSAAFAANATERKEFFDTWIAFEKAENVTSLDGVAAKAGSLKWNTIEQNDDNGEMPAQPSGSKYNSLMRMTSEVSNPLKALTMGLYRVCFTTYKTGEVKGSFLAQLGAPVKLPGVKIASSIADLGK